MCEDYKIEKVNGKIIVTNLCTGAKSIFETINEFYKAGIAVENIVIPSIKDSNELVAYLCATEESINQTKTYVETIERRDPDNPKELIALKVFRDDTTGLPCYYLESDENLTTTININDYDMANYAGLPPVAQEKTTGKISIEVCGELVGTYADLLAALLLDSSFVMPDGTAPDGLIGLEIIAQYKGQTCGGMTTTGQGGSKGGDEGFPLVSIDGGESWCSKVNYTDADCDGKAANCLALTTPINFPAGHGFKIVGIGVVCDADDLDVTV